MPRITLKMIAEAAHTSIGTVDRAINGRSGIKEDKRQQILKIAEDLGYQSNRMASALSRRKDIRIAVLIPLFPSGFYSEIESGVDLAAEELRDYGVYIEKLFYESQNPELALSFLKSVDISAYDAIAINSAGGAVEGEISRISSVVPVATYNTDAPNSKRLFYVGSNARLSGLMGGELMDLFLQGKGTVTALGNYARTAPFADRFGGFCEYLQQNTPEITAFPAPDCLNDSKMAARVLIDMINRIPQISGIFSTGYASTIGAAEALRTLNRKDIVLVGYDISPESVRAMEESWCNALLYQAPQQQGYLVCHLLVKHLLEGWLPEMPHYYVEPQIVLKSNLSLYTGIKKPQLLR